MNIQAKWRGHTFSISTQQIKALEDLSISKEADTAEGPTINGKRSLKFKGLALEALSLEYTTAPAVGGDPRSEYEAFKNDAGESGFLYIGGKTYGAGKFILRAVALDVSEITAAGAFIVAKIKLDFIEAGAETSAAATEPRAEIGTTGKKSAVKIGPTKEEKKNIVSEMGAQNVNKQQRKPAAMRGEFVKNSPGGSYLFTPQRH